ncbi:MAG: nucleotidyl transferase AbiEii/AbiGii toxin family protein, partial [Pseudomonadales bacterium]|nr:nucleotidyl transferase AbiEii/AbiGii toxin family protein [Pseudomonadales bacterium]
MSSHQSKNVQASIHQRLLNTSKQSGRRFNDLVMYYALERFLYRLSQSEYAERFILKGGLMMNVWQTTVTRVTRDIDLLGRFDCNPESIAQVVSAICDTDIDDDGLIFDSESVNTKSITEDADYQGVRAQFRGYFGKMPLAMQIDFGFSDTVSPKPTVISYPTLLDHPSAKLLAYNRETVVAEKFEAMVKLGELNSRMRDFFDIWALSQCFNFDGNVLADAIRSTFTRRGTELEVSPACFEDSFAKMSDKNAQWKSFLRTANVSEAPANFSDVIDHIRNFIEP